MVVFLSPGLLAYVQVQNKKQSDFSKQIKLNKERKGGPGNGVRISQIVRNSGGGGRIRRPELLMKMQNY